MPAPEKHELFGTDLKEPCPTHRRLGRELPWGEFQLRSHFLLKELKAKKKKIEGKLRKINFIGEVMKVVAQFRDKN